MSKKQQFPIGLEVSKPSIILLLMKKLWKTLVQKENAMKDFDVALSMFQMGFLRICMPQL